MKSTGLIVVTTAGLVPPKQYLQMAYAKFPTYGGSSARIVDGEAAELIISQDEALPPIDDLLKDLEENKDIASILYFANSKTPLSTESEQPFTIIGDTKTPLIVGFIEGDFAAVHSEHTEEYHIFNNMLGPQLRKIYEKMCGSDLDKFEQELLDPDTEKLINSFSIARGVVLLQSVSGQVFKFEKNNELSKEFPWGWVSNTLGFEEKSSHDHQPEKKEEEPVKRSMGNRFGPKKTTTVPLVIANTEPAKTDVGTIIAKENTKTATALPDHAGRPMISCPEDIRKKGKNFYTPWYATNTVDIGLTRDQMKNGAEAPANDDYIAKNSGKHMKLADAKDALLKKIEASKGRLPDPPIIQPHTRHLINTYLDSGEIRAKTESGRILSSEELKAPPKVAPWSAQFGRELMEVYRWDREIIEKFIDKCETNKDRLGIVLLIEELTRENLKLMLDDNKPSDTKAEDVIVKTEPDKTPETPADPPPVKKTGTSRFASRKAA